MLTSAWRHDECWSEILWRKKCAEKYVERWKLVEKTLAMTSVRLHVCVAGERPVRWDNTASYMRVPWREMREVALKMRATRVESGCWFGSREKVRQSFKVDDWGPQAHELQGRVTTLKKNTKHIRFFASMESMWTVRKWCCRGRDVVVRERIMVEETIIFTSQKHKSQSLTVLPRRK